MRKMKIEIDWGWEERKITKVGNSLFIALPPRYATRLQVKKGDHVKLETARLGKEGQRVLVISKK